MLNNIFFQQLCAIGKISIRWIKNKQRTIEKEKNIKNSNG